jgi:hypothetical protein
VTRRAPSIVSESLPPIDGKALDFLEMVDISRDDGLARDDHDARYERINGSNRPSTLVKICSYLRVNNRCGLVKVQDIEI